MRAGCSITRADLDQALADGRKLRLCERVCLRNGGAHGKETQAQPKATSAAQRGSIVSCATTSCSPR